LPGKDSDNPVRLVVVTGMNYSKFHYGKDGDPDHPGKGSYSGTGNIMLSIKQVLRNFHVVPLLKQIQEQEELQVILNPLILIKK